MLSREDLIVIDSFDFLTERDKSMLIHRLEGKTLQEIGFNWNLTKERVSKILNKMAFNISRKYVILKDTKNLNKKERLRKIIEEYKIFIPYAAKVTTNSSIWELEFNVRTFNCLNRNGVNTLAKIIEFIESGRSIRNLGNKSYNEIVNKLLKLGYTINKTIKVERKQEAEKIDIT